MYKENIHTEREETVFLPLSSVEIIALTPCPGLDLVSNPFNRLFQILSSLNYYLISSLLGRFSVCFYVSPCTLYYVCTYT